jgi:uncharacterized protein YjbI with pentapeptide repeats
MDKPSVAPQALGRPYGSRVIARRNLSEPHRMDDQPAETLSEKFYEDRIFKSLNCVGQDLSGIEFYNCSFQASQFQRARWPKCRLEKCVFESCDLSLAALPETSLVDVRMTGCKMIGVNWTQVAMPFALEFERCNLSQSVFMDLDLQRIAIEDCIAREVDFSGANLTRTRLCRTDFQAARFLRTNLSYSDLSGATNYQIDPTQNRLKKTIFSLPEAVSLLSAFDIILR